MSAPSEPWEFWLDRWAKLVDATPGVDPDAPDICLATYSAKRTPLASDGNRAMFHDDFVMVTRLGTIEENDGANAREVALDALKGLLEKLDR